MSSVLHPVGPDSPGTYWARRIGVLAAVILVVAVVIWAIPKPDNKTVPAEPAPASDTSTSTSPSAPASEESSPASPAPPSSTAPSSPPPIVECTAAVTKVTTTGPTRVAADKAAKFKVTVTNDGPVTCKLGISASTFELRVISGSDQIWTTKHCGKWLPKVKTTKVKPGKSISVTIEWPGKRSTSDCKVTGGLRPGTYVAKAFYGNADPGNLIMSLR